MKESKRKRIKYCVIALLATMLLLLIYLPDMFSVARYEFAVNLKIGMEQKVTPGETFHIIYELNGGIQGANAPTTIGTNETVNLPTPTKEGYVFLGWYDNANFTGSSKTTLSNVTSNVRLYAKWIAEKITIKYHFGDNIEFDGTSYINTGLNLFSDADKNRDIEMTVDILENEYLTGQTGNYNTFFNCVDHKNSPYHGFLLRRNQNKVMFKRTNTATTVAETNYNPGEIQSVRLVRENKKLYADFNNSLNLVQVGDYTNLTTSINYPLVFGADIDSGGAYFRFLKGKLSNITTSYTYDYTEVPITLPKPIRKEVKFMGWYSDPQFTNKIGSGLDVYSPLDDITLYAKWETIHNEEEEPQEEYTYSGEYDFDENGYINTNVYLYTSENIHRNFEMSFDIVDLGNSSSNATLMSATKNILRISNATNELSLLETFGNIANNSVKDIPNTVTKVKIMRIDDILYVSFNGNDFVKINNYTNSTNYSNLPVLFGADFDADGDVYRKFKGTLADMQVRFIEDGVSIEDYNKPARQLQIAYQQAGEYLFDGTNHINTGIKLFDFDNYDKDFEISFNIVEIDPNCVGQGTIVNSKYEVTPYPGFVYRLQTDKTKIEFTAACAVGAPVSHTKSSVEKVKISRRDFKVYIQINDGAETQAYNFDEFIHFMNTPVTIGSSLNSSGNPFRFFTGKLSDIVIKLEQD